MTPRPQSHGVEEQRVVKPVVAGVSGGHQRLLRVESSVEKELREVAARRHLVHQRVVDLVQPDSYANDTRTCAAPM